MAKDFRSKQLRTSILIGSGSVHGSKPSLGMLIYSSSAATSFDGSQATGFGAAISSIGNDTWLVISGSKNNSAVKGSSRADGSAVTFLGDVIVSGTLWSERMIVEVDDTVPGDFYVKNNTLISGSFAAGTVSVAGGTAADLILAAKNPAQTSGLGGPIVTFRKYDSPFPITITDGGDGGDTNGAQNFARTPRDVWFHVSGAIGSRHHASDGHRGSTRYRGVALFDGDLHTSGNLSTDGELGFSGFIGNDVILLNASTPGGPPSESPHLFISSSAYTPVTASSPTKAPFMELGTDQFAVGSGEHGLAGTHWWVDLTHSGTSDYYGGLRFKTNAGAYATHHREMRFKANGNLILQGNVDRPRFGLLFSGTGGGFNVSAAVRYFPKTSLLKFGHHHSLTAGGLSSTGSFYFHGGVITASNGLRFNEGDFDGTTVKGGTAQFGQQHGVMFEGNGGAGVPKAGFFYNSAARNSPFFGGETKELSIVIDEGSGDKIILRNVKSTLDHAIYLSASAGGVTFDADNGNVTIADGGTNTLRFDSATSAGNVIVKSMQAASDILFNDSADEVFRLDASENSILMAGQNPIQFAASTAQIWANGSGGSGNLNITSLATGLTGSAGVNAAVQIVASNAAGGIRMDSGTAGTENNSTGQIKIGNDAVAAKITIGGELATRTEVEINAIEVDINGGATGVTIDALDAGSIDIGAGTGAAFDTSAINIGTSNTARTITVGHAASTLVDINATAIELDSAGTLVLDSDGITTIGAAAFNIDADGGAGSGTIAIDTTDSTNGIAIGTANLGIPITIGHITSSVTVNDDLDVMGNLTVHGDFIKGHIITASVGDPLLLLNSGSVSSNSGGGIAIASGSSYANQAMVYGRDAVNNDTFLIGRLDVQDGLVDNIAGAEPINFRAAGFDVAKRFTVPFLSASLHNGGNTQHVSMSNLSTNGDIFMRATGNMIVTASNVVLKNGTRLWVNPTTSDGGPYYIESDMTNNRLALGVGTGALWLKSTSGTGSRIAFDDDGKNIREISNELRVTSDEGIGIQAAAGVDIDGTTIDIDGTSTVDIDGAGALTIDSATSISLGTTADVPFDVDTSTLDIDASGAVTIDGTSTIAITGSDAGPAAIRMKASAGGVMIQGVDMVQLTGSTALFSLASARTVIDAGGGGVVAISGSLLSFQKGKKMVFAEGADDSYIQHTGGLLKISNTNPVRLSDALRIEFGSKETIVGLDAVNKRFASVFDGVGTAPHGDMIMSSSQNTGKITLQASSSGAALQLRGDGGVAGASYMAMGYVSGTLDTKIFTVEDVSLLVSGARGSIQNSSIRGSSTPQRGTALFMGDMITSGALHVQDNIIASGSITTAGNLLTFTNGQVKVVRDGSDMKFTDPTAGTVTLSYLNTKVLAADQTFLIAPGTVGNNYYTSVRTTGSFSFDYDPTNGTYTPRNTSDIGTDVYFFVSGTVGGKTNHRTTKTVSVFGGDIHISGTLTSDNTTFGGSLDQAYDTPDGGGASSPGAGSVITVDYNPVQMRKDNNAYSTTTLLSVSGSSRLHNLLISAGDSAPDVKLSLTGSSGAMIFASNPGGSGQRDIFGITGGSGNLKIFPDSTDGKLAFAQESSTYIRLDNDSTPKDLQIYNSTGTGKISLVTGTGAGSPGTVEMQAHMLPTADNSYDLGSVTNRWANLYTGDLHLANERGNWTIYEEPDMLVVVNNLTGKKYKMNLTPLEDEE